VTRLHPGKGFLGTGATFAADLNLVAQLIMACALIAGAFLARRKRYTAHGICQTTVLLLNLIAIGFVMAPSFGQQVRPELSKAFHDWYYAAAAFHALFGIAAEALGIYVALVAGTKLPPQWLCFKNWKRWMRVELMLWCCAVLTGVGTYYTWYIAPFR
jgi:uncharacterized membrane protein YozB (DUF420 family)